MALDQTAMEQQAPEMQRLTDEEEQDLSIMVNLAKEAIDDGGIDVIDQAIEQSNDPGQVVGQFLLQLGSQLAEQLPEDMTISPRIMLAEGGWVEEVSDYLQEQYGVDKEVMDRAEMYIGASAEQMAMQQQQQQAAPVQQPQQAPALPQQGGVV